MLQKHFLSEENICSSLWQPLLISSVKLRENYLQPHKSGKYRDLWLASFPGSSPAFVAYCTLYLVHSQAPPQLLLHTVHCTYSTFPGSSPAFVAYRTVTLYLQYATKAGEEPGNEPQLTSAVHHITTESLSACWFFQGAWYKLYVYHFCSMSVATIHMQTSMGMIQISTPKMTMSVLYVYLQLAGWTVDYCCVSLSNNLQNPHKTSAYLAEGAVWCKFGETCVDFHGACVAVNLFIKQKSSVLKPWEP